MVVIAEYSFVLLFYGSLETLLLSSHNMVIDMVIHNHQIQPSCLSGAGI